MSASSQLDALPGIGIVVRDAIRGEGLASMMSGLAVVHPVTPAEAARNGHLSIVMLDADDSVFSMLAAFRRARAGLRVMVFGSETDAGYIGRIVAAGAKAYLHQESSAEEVRAAVSVVQDGSIWAPRKVLASLIDTYSPDLPVRMKVVFTGRERQVLELLVAGQSDREIASNLAVSPRTVQSVVSRLLRKISVPNRVALTVRVLEQHLLTAI